MSIEKKIFKSVLKDFYNQAQKKDVPRYKAMIFHLRIIPTTQSLVPDEMESSKICNKRFCKNIILNLRQYFGECWNDKQPPYLKEEQLVNTYDMYNQFLVLMDLFIFVYKNDLNNIDQLSRDSYFGLQTQEEFNNAFEYVEDVFKELSEWALKYDLPFEETRKEFFNILTILKNNMDTL